MDFHTINVQQHLPPGVLILKITNSHRKGGATEGREIIEQDRIHFMKSKGQCLDQAWGRVKTLISFSSTTQSSPSYCRISSQISKCRLLPQIIESLRSVKDLSTPRETSRPLDLSNFLWRKSRKWQKSQQKNKESFREFNLHLAQLPSAEKENQQPKNLSDQSRKDLVKWAWANRSQEIWSQIIVSQLDTHQFETVWTSWVEIECKQHWHPNHNCNADRIAGSISMHQSIKAGMTKDSTPKKRAENVTVPTARTTTERSWEKSQFRRG